MYIYNSQNGEHRWLISIFLFSVFALGKSDAAAWNTNSGAWNVATNWTPNGVPNLPGTDVDFAQNVVATSTITIPGTFDVRNIIFSSLTQNYILSGGTLNTSPTVAPFGITVAAGPTHTISSNLNLLAAPTITQNSANPLTISGAISGATAITKAGVGELILSGTSPNGYSGLLTINAGTVTLDKSAGINALGAGGVTINTGTLKWNQSNQIPIGSAITINNPTSVLNLNGNTETVGTLTFGVTATGTYTLGGTLNLSSSAVALTAPAASTPTINGQINLTSSTGGSVSKTTAGTLTLGNVGVLNGTHDFTGTGPITITGIVSGDGGLSKSGTGTLLLSGASSNTYTSPTIVTAGTLQLNKTAGVAIPGDCTINGGIVLASMPMQFANTSNLTINTGGTYNMNSLDETLGSLTMTGGTISGNTVGLSLTSTGTALSLRNVTIPGQIFLTSASGGDVFQSSLGGTGGTLTNIDLGSVNRNFMISDTPPAVDLNITGVISGSGGIIKSGIGTLQFSLNSSNSYTGLTTVSQGTLLLNKTAPFLAVNGNLLINGGTVQLALANQINDNSNVQIESGVFNLNNLAETIGSLTYNGGTLNQGTGVLSLSSTGTALTMRNTVVNGTINLTGLTGGNVVFDNTNGGVSFINNINLGNVNRTFTIAGGSDPNIKMVVFNSSGAGGGTLTKSGPGILELLGTNTYAAGAQVSSGTLAVTGTLTCPTVTQAQGSFIKGTGTITSNCTLNGVLQPGNSIGTINLVGNQIFGSTFILENEINQTSTDLVNITGALTINPGASVSVLPLVSSFTSPSLYTIIQTSTGVAGTFSTVDLPLFFYNAQLIYNPLTVQLQIQSVGFADIVDSGNAGVVARYLDGLTIPPGSDLASVVTALRETTSAHELKRALYQLQPSPLKALALSQENNAFRIESYIFERTKKTCSTLADERKVWVAASGDFYSQRSIGEEKPFKTSSSHVLLGFEDRFKENFLIGGVGGFTHSDINYKQISDEATINSGTLALYGSLSNNNLFLQSLILGSFNYYKEQRHIHFTSLNRTATSNPSGGQFLCSLSGGGSFYQKLIKITPFISGELMYLGINKFKEHGAESINLKVSSSNYNLFRGKLGVDFSRCYYFSNFHLGVDLNLSFIHENRFQGKKFTAEFEGYSTFTVNGMNPTRNAFSPAINFSFISSDDLMSLTFGYGGEFGRRYNDNNVFLQGSIAF